MRKALVLNSFDSQHTRERSITIISSSSPIKTVFNHHWFSRRLVFIPTFPIRLLV
jgi:hypothetical protein